MENKDIIDFYNNAAKITFEDSNGLINIKGLGEIENPTCVYGYDKNGEQLFFAAFDKNNNYRLSLYSQKNGMRIEESFYSNEGDETTLSPARKQALDTAGIIIKKLNTKQKIRRKFKEGFKVKLSQDSRISLAPNVDEVTIQQQDDGTLKITGTSKNDHQSFEFTHNTNHEMELTINDGNVQTKYDNKYGSWSYRDPSSPKKTRYYHDECEGCAKKLAEIIQKAKNKIEERENTNQSSFRRQPKQR